MSACVPTTTCACPNRICSSAFRRPSADSEPAGQLHLHRPNLRRIESTSDGDHLGQDADGDLVRGLGADLEAHRRVDAGELEIDDVARASSQFFSLLKGEPHMQLVLGCCDRTDAGAHIAASVDMFLRAYASDRCR